MNINEVLDQIGEDVLSADTKEMLVEAFNEAVEQQMKQQMEAEITSALQKLDEEHTEQLQQLLEAIDTDHTSKLQNVIKKIDEDHSNKLTYLVKKYQKVIKEDATQFKSSLVKQLSNYLDLYLEETIPAQDIAEAVENKQAQRILNEIKQIVSVDEEFINNTIREAVQDGRKQIQDLKQELSEAVKSNIRINQEAKAAKAELILEQATRRYGAEKQAFIKKTLRGKDPEYITENLDYVVKMFDRDENETKTLLAEEAKKGTKSMVVDTPKSRVNNKLITENADQSNEGGSVSEYLQSLQSQDRYVRKS